MEKIVIQFVPDLKDYSHVIRSFYTRKRSYWIGLGVAIAISVILLPLSIFNLLTGDMRTGLYFIPLLLLLAFLVSIPLWNGWLTIRSASKTENLTLPATYELGDEKVFVVNQIAEVKYDWSMFSRAFEDRNYYFITYSTNKYMFQFIPKRAFVSIDQKRMARELIVRHLGEIEETSKGLKGWKLAGLAAILFIALLLCIIGVAVVATFLVE